MTGKGFGPSLSFYDASFFLVIGRDLNMNSILKRALLPGFTISLESAEADGTTAVEREYEIYGTVEDLPGMIAKAERSEKQEQWGMPCSVGGDSGVSGNIRVRKTTVDKTSSYTQTIKVKMKDGNNENEMEISADTFNIFASLVPNGLIKTRYFFSIEGTELTLEVDVFEDTDGKQHDQVKIDLEVAEGETVDSVQLPFKLNDVRVIAPGIKSMEDLEFVRKLFRDVYEVSNPLHGKDD